MTPYAAALHAARQVREDMPDAPSTGVIFQIVAPDAVLSIVLNDLAEAMAIGPAIASLGDELILIADTYHLVGTPGAPFPDPLPEPGELARRFNDGDPGVTEALVVASVARHSSGRVTVMPYARPPITWGTPVVLRDDEHLGGRLLAVLRDALDASEPATGASLYPMTWAAGQLTRHGYGADVTPRP